ncbi:MAG: thioredoxin family protein [Cyclobacteriaceae bacterium]
MAVELVSDTEFKEKLDQNEKVVVKYYADWCGSCRLFKPKYRRLSEDERFADVTFLDVNAEKNPEARKLAGVSNLPYFAVFKKGELLEGVASSKEEAVVDLIQKLNS